MSLWYFPCTGVFRSEGKKYEESFMCALLTRWLLSFITYDSVLVRWIANPRSWISWLVPMEGRQRHMSYDRCSPASQQWPRLTVDLVRQGLIHCLNVNVTFTLASIFICCSTWPQPFWIHTPSGTKFSFYISMLRSLLPGGRNVKNA